MALEQLDDRAGKVSEELRQLPPALFNQHRLMIMLELYGASGVDYPQLKHDIDITDGALATHLKVLGAEGLIEVSKERERDNSRERTGYLITRKGMQSVERLARLSDVIRQVIADD